MVALQMLLIVTALGADGDTALLNFSGPNCPHCKTMEPVLAKLEAAGMPIRTINVEQHPEIARRFNVSGIPTFVMLVNGREANRVVGSASAEKLQALFPVNLAPLTGDVRGQSPSEPSGNFVGQRLGGMFGKGKPNDSGGAPTADPFTQRGTTAPAAEAQTLEHHEPIASLAPAAPISPASHTFAPEIGLLTQQMKPQERAMAASVRLKVEDAKGHSLGSGTIIDTHGNEAMIITCGHIFRDSQGQGRISVDLFHPQPRTVEGKVLEYDLKRDIALVTISAGPDLTTAAVAPESLQVQKGEAAFSIGCDRGQDPSLRPTQISGLNRYQGPPNIEAKGQPVDGRSGGGLFSPDGHLIGVCNAADPADDEGIYAAMGTIHWQLAKVGLEQLYKQNVPADLMAEENSTNEAANRLAEVGRNVPEFSAPRSSVPASTTAAPNATDAAGDTEVICIVRSKSNPSAKGQVIHIARATPELLKQLASSSSDPTVAADLAMQTEQRSAMSPVTSAIGPVVRGQSRR